jgi:hypothetical protein
MTAHKHDPARHPARTASARNGVGVLCLHGFPSSPLFLLLTIGSLQ